MTNAARISFRKHNVFNILPVIALAMSAVLCASPAAAQDKDNSDTSSSQRAVNVAPSDGLSLNLSGFTTEGLSTQYDIAPINLPSESVGSTLFKLDLANTDCLTGEATCFRRDEIDLGVSKSITALSATGIDFSLTPRASLRFDDDGRSAVVGAVIEIGEDLREGSEFDNNTWYFFAGADAEALTYSPNSVSRMTSGQFHLQDRIIVGDAQAGLGYRIGDADVSLSYMRREATAEDFSYKEDAAALSLTWKR